MLDQDQRSRHLQSHGEGVIEILKTYFVPNGLYLLDEPESALSPTSQFMLLNLIHELSQKCNCQFIIATHSPIIGAYKHSEIFEFVDETIITRKNVDETLLFNLYKRFINDEEYRESILNF